MHTDAVVHRAVEFLIRPRADPGLAVGGDVRGVDTAERCVESQTPGEWFAALTQVA